MARQPRPIERPPHDAILPRGWRASMNYGLTYRVRDGDTWENVADRFLVGARDLIYFNFMTNVTDEVNYYLRVHTGCNKVSPSGNNWMFSSSANPGIIWIPPADHDPIDGDPEEICVWQTDGVAKFILRLAAISRGVPGNDWDRIRKVIQVIQRTGYPACRDLWFYNGAAVLRYVRFETDNAERREMTKATGGALPFDGDSGYSTGEWQIHPAAALFDEFGCGSWDAAALKHRLETIDDAMYSGWYQLSLLSARTSQGGGSAYGELVSDFLGHVQYLSQDDTHLYSAFRE